MEYHSYIYIGGAWVSAGGQRGYGATYTEPHDDEGGALVLTPDSLLLTPYSSLLIPNS